MRPAKSKTSEPSLRDKLSESFLRAIEADFREHGPAVIEQMRQTHPERYAELAGKLIMTAEQAPGPNDYSDCQSMDDIGRKLLRSVGINEFAITQNMIEAAIKANDNFVETLEQIGRGN